MTLQTAISNAERAAVILMLMEDAEAAKLLASLEPDELQQLGEQMIALGDVDPGRIAGAIEGFVKLADDNTMTAHDRPAQVRERMTQALGDVKADSIMQRITPAAPAPSLELARWLAPAVLLPLVENEHPQAIAVLLLQLDADVAAAALSALPEDLHTPVLHRVAKLGPVSRQAIDILEGTLNAKIEKLHGTIPLTMGGIKHAAEIINQSHRSVEKRVLPTIGKIDKKLAKELENEMFKFEHLFALDMKMTGVLLREVESDTLIMSLKGLEEDRREQFYGAMSSRAADGLRDEIELRGRVKKSDVEAAQKEVVAIAKRLIAQGDIIMGEGDEDYV